MESAKLVLVQSPPPASVDRFPYRWAWGYGQRVWALPDDRQNRKGQACRLICRGSMNSALIEFEDGHRMVASRNGLRRRSR